MSLPTRSGRKGKDDALANLISLLELETLELNLFRGQTAKGSWKRVYGGQVVAQALMAAIRTVDETRPVHSLHAYFLLPGDPTAPIIYEVDRIRDGKSFTTRSVRAIQHGQPIFALSASFQRPEAGMDHQAAMPKVTPPEELPSEAEMTALIRPHIPENMKSYLERERPIEVRPLDVRRYTKRLKLEPVQNVWFKARGKLPDERTLHQCVLAYASDFTLLDTALIAHGKLLFDADVQLASLDHAIWFHRPFRADDWLLYAQTSPSAQAARGFCLGSIFARDGTLVASVAQEGLTRTRATAFAVR